MSEDTNSEGLNKAKQEADDLLGQALVGDAPRVMLRVGLHVVMTWVLIIGVLKLGDQLLPLPDCVSACCGGKAEDCCSTNIFFLTRVFLVLLAAGVGSYFSTRLTKRKKFQHSNMVTVFTMVSLGVVAWFLGMPGWVVVGVPLLMFFAMFAGYRYSFR